MSVENVSKKVTGAKLRKNKKNYKKKNKKNIIRISKHFSKTLKTEKEQKSYIVQKMQNLHNSKWKNNDKHHKKMFNQEHRKT